MRTPSAWSILIDCRGSNSEVCPSGKCIRMATPFFMSVRLHSSINLLTKYLSYEEKENLSIVTAFCRNAHFMFNSILECQGSCLPVNTCKQSYSKQC